VGFSFIDGGNQSTRRKPPIVLKSLTNLRIIIYIFIYSPKSYYIEVYTQELELIKRVKKIQIEKSAFIINIMLKVSVSDSHKSYLTDHPTYLPQKIVLTLLDYYYI
jgi:hypothetical protein